MDKNAWLVELSQSPKTRFWKIDYSQLSEPEQVFVSVWELEAEREQWRFRAVLLQLGRRQCAGGSLNLRAIGANNMAGIVEQATVYLAQPAAQGSGGKAADSRIVSPDVTTKLDELDTQFYKYPDNSAIYSTTIPKSTPPKSRVRRKRSPMLSPCAESPVNRA